jgi:NADH:ubiquinone oxidoreductase subunit 6 (subunit J)
MGDSSIFLVLVGGAIICAYCAMTAKRMLTSTLYLAGVSAGTALTLYKLGAFQVAVIELSVGAGLVTVLLVYAISVVGDDATDPGPVIPMPIAVALAAVAVVLLGRMGLSLADRGTSGGFPPLLQSLWQQRVLDVWIQMVLIFAGVLGILGLLAEGKRAKQHADPQKVRSSRTVKVIPPTACGFPTVTPRHVEEIREEVHV